MVCKINLKHSLFFCRTIGLVLTLCWVTTSALAQVCAAPGVAGTLTVATANTVVNTYYPGSGTTSNSGSGGLVTLGAVRSGGGAALAAGDLILIIQMQDGTALNTSNSLSYGGGGTSAGLYEFARVASVSGSMLNLTTALTNTYVNNTAVASNQTFQVIRVPQYSTLTINAASSIVPLPWDGNSGGVVAFDVAGVFTNNGAVDVSYAGFRGNAGLSLGGVAGAAAITTYDWAQADTYAAHGGKGEGIAGTPNRVLQVFSSAGVLATGLGNTSATANGVSTNATTSANLLSAATGLVTTGRSYNGGSRSGGTAGNAGGGGVDSSPSGNSENSGGGGGGSWGTGGKGGNSWNTNYSVGGLGGAGASSSTAQTYTPSISLLTNPALSGRAIMGGGGGSGTTNNGYSLNDSGGAGGGLIFIKTQSLAGTGSLLANGQAGRSVPAGDGTQGTTNGQCPANNTSSCDGGGGGGAGGGIVVIGPATGTVNAQVVGGQGGNINGTNHGPGGGGGGGYVIATTGITVSVTNNGGAAGLMNIGNGTPTAYGAFAGIAGTSLAVAAASTPAVAGGLPSACLPVLTTTKVTAVPAATASIVPPATTTYSIVVANTSGRGDARAVTVYDPALPSTMSVANPALPVVSFSASPTACTLGSRTAVVDPANGATTAFTGGTFSLPGGCTLTYTFTVNVPTTVPDGTYNNSAVAYFRDPTDASGTRTVTNATFVGGLAGASTSFTTGGGVGGSNYDGSQVANTGEDVKVQRLQLYKAVTLTGDVVPIGTVSPGDTVTWSIFVRNPGATGTSVQLQVTDTLPTGLNFTAGSQTISQTSGTCGALAGPPGQRSAAFTGLAANNALIAAAQSIPGGCTIRIDVPTQVPSNTMLSSVTNTAALSGTTTVGATLAVTSSNLDTPSGVASAIPGIGAGSYPSGSNVTQSGAIQATPTISNIQQAVNLTVSKTNGATTVVAGATTSYTVTVANLGPSTATNALLTDPVAAGLSCTAVSCSAASAVNATCPVAGSTTIANLQNGGIALTLAANSTLSFVVSCGIKASGQ